MNPGLLVVKTRYNRDRRIYCLACAKIFKPSQKKGWQLATGNWPQVRKKAVKNRQHHNRRKSSKERDLPGWRTWGFTRVRIGELACLPLQDAYQVNGHRRLQVVWPEDCNRRFWRGLQCYHRPQWFWQVEYSRCHLFLIRNNKSQSCEWILLHIPLDHLV